jgi:hypothetical protein
MSGHIVRKGEAEPSPVRASQVSPVAQRVVPAPADAPIPAGHRTKASGVNCPFRSQTYRQSHAGWSCSYRGEYEALALVAVKKDTTPQHLTHNVLREFLVEFVQQGDGFRGRQD